MIANQDDLTKEQWREYAAEVTRQLDEERARCADLQRSADGAREIAKIAQDSNGVRGMRAQIDISGGKFNVVVCAPGNDEASMARIVAEHLVAAFGIQLGLKFEGDVKQAGSTV